MALLLLWVVCMVFVTDLLVDVPEFDGVRPRAGWYRSARESTQRLVGTAPADHRDLAAERTRRQTAVLFGTWTIGAVSDALQSWRPAVRRHMLKTLVREDVRDARLAGQLLEIAESEAIPESQFAQVILMRLTGDRTEVAEIARLAAREQRTAVFRELLQRFDPRHAEVLTALARLENSDGRLPVPLEGLLETLAATPAAGVRRLVDAMATTRGPQFHTTLSVALRLRPLSKDLTDVLLRRYESASETDRSRIVRMLGSMPVHFGRESARLAEFFAEHLSRARSPDVPFVMRVLRKTRAPTDVVVRKLAEIAHRGGEDARVALQTLAALGPSDSRYAQTLTSITEPELRVEVTRALAAMRTGGLREYWEQRLNNGSVAEQWVILREVPEFPDGATMVPMIERHVEDPELASLAFSALARLHAEETSDLAPLLLAGGTSQNPSIRTGAFEACNDMRHVPVVILSMLVEGVDDPDPRARKAAETSLGNLARLGPGALPVQPILGLIAEGGSRPAGFRAGLLKTLGALDVDHPQVRQLLVKSLRDSNRTIREAALQAIADLETPTEDECRAVARAFRHGHLTGRCREVLALPQWDSVRRRSGIKTGTKIVSKPG